MSSIVFSKAKKFSIRIVKLHKYLCSDKSEYTLSKQLLRSGTSIGANLAEALHSISSKKFLAKIQIACKESAETVYWLELLREANILSEKEFASIYADAVELLKMLTSITKSTSRKLNSPDINLKNTATAKTPDEKLTD